MKNDLADEIDALLPQTQCGLCGYGACRPYANAIAYENESIDKCPPGGIPTLKKLAQLLGKDSLPYLSEMEGKQKPNTTVVIRESECIGCTKCIQVCPVDAILGANKQMHSVISSECTGCELCIPACPVDCIDVVVIPTPSESIQHQQANLARERFRLRSTRLAVEKNDQEKRYKKTKLDASAAKEQIVSARKVAIEAAIQRVKAKSRSNES